MYMCVFWGVGGAAAAASITECPGGFFLPASAQRESGEAGHQTTADSTRTKPGGVAQCVSVCVCACSAGLWPSVLQRTERKCEATGPRKRMPSSAAGVAKGLAEMCVYEAFRAAR